MHSVLQSFCQFLPLFLCSSSFGSTLLASRYVIDDVRDSVIFQMTSFFNWRLVCVLSGDKLPEVENNVVFAYAERSRGRGRGHRLYSRTLGTMHLSGVFCDFRRMMIYGEPCRRMGEIFCPVKGAWIIGGRWPRVTPLLPCFWGKRGKDGAWRGFLQGWHPVCCHYFAGDRLIGPRFKCRVKTTKERQRIKIASFV